MLKWDDVGVCVPPTADYERLDDERAQPIHTHDNPRFATPVAVPFSQLAAHHVILERGALGGIPDPGPPLPELREVPHSIFEWGISHRSDRRQGRKIFPLNTDLRTLRAAGSTASAARFVPAEAPVPAAAVSVEITLVLIPGRKIVADVDLPPDRSWSGSDDDIPHVARDADR